MHLGSCLQMLLADHDISTLPLLLQVFCLRAMEGLVTIKECLLRHDSTLAFARVCRGSQLLNSHTVFVWQGLLGEVSRRMVPITGSSSGEVV